MAKATFTVRVATDSLIANKQNINTKAKTKTKAKAKAKTATTTGSEKDLEMAGNIVKWWKHKILGGYKQFSGKLAYKRKRDGTI